ncbi:Platelet glycoprotein V [Holothuria leucospilota]|uniref:Platelet glycoprotein V n=1 Tax=Holothuria leucospilota TaxID=206669 RepID=A0A9Q1CPH2_HOLLE|nr:Platelet glycoprotein V [Holothuria leucospilota]
MNLTISSELGDEMSGRSVDSLIIANTEASFIKTGNWNFLSHLTHLKQLSFYNNNITNISDFKSMYTKNLSVLETLTIARNKLTFFPVEKFIMLKSLKYLALYCNQLQTLGEREWSLPLLETLHLNINQITRVSEGQLKGLTSLKKLYLNNNRITYFSLKFFDSVPNLQYVNLSRNSLFCFSEYNVLHTSLFSINLESNFFETLNPVSFAGFKSLEFILMSNNLITHPPNTTQDVNVTTTIRLSFRRNKIEALSPLFFDNFPNMHSVAVTNNRISRIADNTFRGVVNLVSLDMEYNEIHTIPANLFRHLHQLSFIGLAHNRINILEPDIFTRLSKQVDLILYHNPIICNCSAVPLLRWLNKATMSRADHPRCWSPKSLRNQAIHLAELSNNCSDHETIKDSSLVITADTNPIIPTTPLVLTIKSRLILKLIGVGLGIGSLWYCINYINVVLGRD